MSNISKGMILYDNWCDMVNKYYDQGDEAAAKDLLFGIMRLYSTGELIDLGRVDLNMMLEYTIRSGIESQIRHYEEGKKGGRPSKISAKDNALIAQNKELGKTAKQIAEEFCVSDDTIRRSDGWRNPQNYTQKDTQNAKPYAPQKQNQEKEKEKEKEEERILLNKERANQLKEEFCADGYSTKLDTWLKVDDTATRQRLYTLGYNDTDIDYVFSNIIE